MICTRTLGSFADGKFFPPTPKLAQRMNHSALCREMGIPIETQTFKFVLGIKDKDVREAILRSDMASYNFQGLVDFAVSLGCSLSFCIKDREGEVDAGLVQVSGFVEGLFRVRSGFVQGSLTVPLWSLGLRWGPFRIRVSLLKVSGSDT